MPYDLNQRIRCKDLLGKLGSVETAVSLIQNGMTVGVCSDLLPLCRTLEKQGKEGRNLRIQLWSGVAILQADRILGKLGMIERRIGQQTLLRAPINAKQVEYLETPLGFFYQGIRGGELGNLDLAIVEAVGITREGNLIPAYRLHDMANFVQAAERVVVQLSTCYPLDFEGVHDVYLPDNPPHKKPIPILRADDRVGTPYVPLDPQKVACIYFSEHPETVEMI
ncbi:MAG: acetyl-CoA hydrolase, partial [Thermodesulfobacteriota bacterium]